MRVNISSLKGKRGASLTVEFRVNTLPGLDWGECVTQMEPLLVKGTVCNSGSCYLVRGDIQTTLQLPCSRCLKHYVWHVVAPLEEEFFPSGGNAGKIPQDEESRQFAEESVFVGDTIDLSEAVREQVVLELPLQMLCSEDCAGLCPVCGHDLNAGACNCVQESSDPRLAVLAKLLDKSKNG